MRNRVLLLILLVHCFTLPAFAQNAAKRPLVLQLSNGGYISFHSETATTDDQDTANRSSLPASLQSQAFTAEDQVIHRVLTEANGRVVFAYDLQVKADSLSKKFSLSVQPTDLAFRARLLKDSGAPRLNELFATFPNSTVAQTLDDGDALSLDLLVNQETGVKIVDVVKVTFDRNSLGDGSFESAPRDFSLEAVALAVKGYQLSINGNVVGSSKSGRGFAGSLLWFYIPGRGRFIFSLVPRDGYSFEKIAVLAGSTIQFSLNGEQYEWTSAAPILAGSGTWNLWVLHDTQYTPLFAQEKPPSSSPGLLQKIEDVVGFSEVSPNTQLRVDVSLTGNRSPDSKSVTVPQRIMVGGADRIENLLPKSP